jgi:hypothetical protein
MNTPVKLKHHAINFDANFSNADETASLDIATLWLEKLIQQYFFNNLISYATFILNKCYCCISILNLP